MSCVVVGFTVAGAPRPAPPSPGVKQMLQQKSLLSRAISRGCSAVPWWTEEEYTDDFDSELCDEEAYSDDEVADFREMDDGHAALTASSMSSCSSQPIPIPPCRSARLWAVARFQLAQRAAAEAQAAHGQVDRHHHAHPEPRLAAGGGGGGGGDHGHGHAKGAATQLHLAAHAPQQHGRALP